mgnify:CR=1 FL=1
MAAGLGTRMKSATPKHLHPLLGRRARRLGRRRRCGALGPTRSSSSLRRKRRTRFEGVEVAVQEQPLGTGDSLRAAREQRRRRAGRCSSSPVIIRASAPTCCSSSSTDAPLCGRVGDRALVRAGRSARLRHASSATPTAVCRRSSSDADADDAQRAIREVNSSIYVFEADEAVAGARTDRAGERAGRALPDGRGRGCWSKDGEEVVVFKAPDADEVEGVNTRAELAPTQLRSYATREQGATCSPASRSSIHRRRGSIPTSSSSPTRPSIPSRSLARAHASRRPAPRSDPHAVADRRATSAQTPGSARSVTSGPGTKLGERREGRHLRRDQELRDRCRRRRSRTSPTSATPRSARRHERRAPATSRPTSAPAGPARREDEDRAQRQDRHSQWLRGAGRDRGRRLDCAAVRT